MNRTHRPHVPIGVLMNSFDVILIGRPSTDTNGCFFMRSFFREGIFCVTERRDVLRQGLFSCRLSLQVETSYFELKQSSSGPLCYRWRDLGHTKDSWSDSISFVWMALSTTFSFACIRAPCRQEQWQNTPEHAESCLYRVWSLLWPTSPST